MESFSDSEFDEFSCFVAFARQSGIALIADAIDDARNRFNRLRILVGVDQKGTSKEALEALLSLGIETSVYHTSSPITFHPKIYLFEGRRKNRLIVGSSNLTQKGLFQNLEASIQVDFTLPDNEGQDLLKQVHEYVDEFLERKCDNVKELTSELIDLLVQGELVPNEKEIREPEIETFAEDQEGSIPRSIFPPVKMQSLPAFPSSSTRVTFEKGVEYLLYNYPDGLGDSEIYPEYEKRFQLTWKQREQTRWREPRFHQEIRATLNDLVNEGRVEQIGRAKYRTTHQLPIVGTDVEESITYVVNDCRASLSDDFEVRRNEINRSNGLLEKVNESRLSISEFRSILSGINSLTGAIGEKEIGRQNIERLCRHNISRINNSLKLLFSRGLAVDERVDRLLNGNERLSGGGIGFISTMLFLMDSSNFNIFNEGVLRGLRIVFPDARKATSGESYVFFNELAMRFKVMFALNDEEVDNILWNLGRDHSVYARDI
jgi:HKD family nuclease